MRFKREIRDGAIYYVASEVNHWEMALIKAEVKQILLDLIEIAKKKFDFRLYNLDIMDNYINLIIKPSEKASISDIMQWIKCNSAKKLNKMHNTNGHLWGHRFFSRIIKNKKDFLRTSAYIDNSPVEAKPTKEAKNWKFGGLFHKLHGIIELVDEILEEELFFPANAPPIVST